MAIDPNIDKTIELLTTIFKVVAGIAGIYAIFWIANFFMSLRKNKILKEILLNLKEINDKLGSKKKR